MLILASSSPRRRELLANAGISFEITVPEVEEVRRPAEHPRDYSRRLAREKAEAVVHGLDAGAPHLAVLAADTIVICGDEVMEKPRDDADAERMLRQLSGREHVVMTAVCLAGRMQAGGRRVDVRDESTRVFMREVPADEITAYVRTGEPRDKAGAYAIQGIASKWIYRIEGDYFNVVGLPVSLVWSMMRAAGLAGAG